MLAEQDITNAAGRDWKTSFNTVRAKIIYKNYHKSIRNFIVLILSRETRNRQKRENHVFGLDFIAMLENRETRNL
jgi:hypothetical protein